jgi:hypothetical protein
MIILSEFLNFIKSSFTEDQYKIVYISENLEDVDIIVKSKNNIKAFSIAILENSIGIGIIDTELQFDFSTFENQFSSVEDAQNYLLKHPLSLLN